MSMMRKFSWMLLVVGCGEEIADDEGKAVKDLVEDEVVAEAEKEIVWEKDGQEMVLIPAGSFQMGDHLDKMKNALPVHEAKLDGFYMDRHEVTVGQFKRFLKQSGYKFEAVKADWDEVEQWSPTDEHPMIFVAWNDATAYAKWAGKRLPNEAEWEYAARGGGVGKRYPWGDDKNVAGDQANYKSIGGRDKWEESTAPVGSFEANGYGLHDMAGNAWEWCQDWYGWDYYSKSPVNNPRGPGKGQDQVLRGGCWCSTANDLRVAYRGRPPFRVMGPTATGFDVCQDRINYS